jgi:penicillin amidase
MKSLAKVTVAVLMVALAAAAGGVTWWLFAALPRVEGTLRLPGLKAPVTIARDEFGIPLISAANQADAYFALGYTHAEDRLWQMEMQRRAGAGRLAEVLGEKALPTDRFVRTLGIYRLAEQSFDGFLPEVREALLAYAAGVNAYLAQPSTILPAEFALLRFAPEPWKPADSLVWGRLMALQLSGNWHDELLRARLLKSLPPDQVADLWPSSAPASPVTIGLADDLIERMLAAVPDLLKPQLASNVWVVSGEHSVTGKPILANDPHLGFQAPTLWYLASISAPGLTVAGATVPGVPFHLLGHNRRIAWGMTTTQSDTMDLFIEKPAGDGYLTPDGPAPFVSRDETIAVRGAPPVTITVRQTRHGPVISDVLGERAEGQLLALSATALLPESRAPQAMYKMNRAGNWSEFTAAVEDFQAPQQNIAYADVDGHIGLISPALVPIRKAGDGTLPHPGWTGEYDWTGWIPMAELPRVFDPPGGAIVNANNRLVPDSYPYLLTANWPEGYRAQRILDRLASQPRHSLDDMGRLQMDELSLMVSDLKPLLLGLPPRGARAAEVYARLRAWNDVTAASAAEPLIFETWLVHLQRSLLEPRMGSLAESFPPIHPGFLKAVLGGRTIWCSEPGRPPVNDCQDKVADALDAALDDITRRFGSDMTKWRWGDAHVAIFGALLFGRISGLAELTRLTVGTGGDDFTVQRGSYAMDGPASFRHLHGAGLRAIYDLADIDASRFVIATGQSGSPVSPHWDDFLKLWHAGQSIALPTPDRARHHLTLEPAP